MCTAAHHHRTPAHMCTTSPTSPWYVGHELAARCSCVVCGQQGAYGCPGQGTTPSRAHDYAQVAAAMLAAARRLAAPPVVMPCPGGTGPLAHYGGRPCCPAPPAHEQGTTAAHCPQCGYPVPHGPAAAAYCRGTTRSAPRLRNTGTTNSMGLPVYAVHPATHDGLPAAQAVGTVARTYWPRNPWAATTPGMTTTYHPTMRAAVRWCLWRTPAPALCWPPAPLPTHWPLYAAGGHTLALSRAQAVRHMVAAGVLA